MDSFAGAAGRVAEDQFVGVGDDHPRRAVAAAGGMDNAADHLRLRQGGGDGAVGVDRAQRLAVREPPGHTVQHWQDDGARADHRRRGAGGGGQGGRLDGDDQEILLADILRLLRHPRVGERRDTSLDQLEPALQCLGGRAPSDQGHRLAGRRQPGRDPAADGAGADDADSHGQAMPLVVAVRPPVDARRRFGARFGAGRNRRSAPSKRTRKAARYESLSPLPPSAAQKGE